MTAAPSNPGPAELADLDWRVSSYSTNGGGDCVEAAPLPDGGVAVRHSREPDGPTILYTAREWRAFLAGARDGEFDF